MSDPDLMNAVDLLRLELAKFNNALYSIGSDALIVRSTALGSPESIDDWSATLAQMQIQADPYPAAVPDPAVDLAEELERIRYQLAVIMGEVFWYIDPDTTIAALNLAIIALQAAVGVLQAGHTLDGVMHTDVAAMAEAEGDLVYWHQVGADLLWRKLARGADGEVLQSTATTIQWATAIPTGVIVMWSGACDAIPDDWHLCDGTDGTPDLRDKFIVGACNTYDPDDEGGALTHNHTGGNLEFSRGGAFIDGPFLGVRSFSPVAAGAGDRFRPSAWAGTTGSRSHLPPYYALAFIIKL